MLRIDDLAGTARTHAVLAAARAAEKTARRANAIWLFIPHSAAGVRAVREL